MPPRRKRFQRSDTGFLDHESFEDLSHRILDAANRYPPRVDFLRETLKMLIEFSGCDSVELWVTQNDIQLRCEASHHPEKSFRFKIIPAEQDETAFQGRSNLQKLCSEMMEGRFDPSLPFFTKRGSFWTGDMGNPLPFTSKMNRPTPVRISGNYRSIALIPVSVGNDNIGLLQLKSKQRDRFNENEVLLHENIAQTLGVALVHQKAQAALIERVKELTCLYGIAQLAAEPGASLEEVLQGIVRILPPAWQYPDIACARITLDGLSYATEGFQNCRKRQTADIIAGGLRRGFVEVAYTRKKPDLGEGPFLKEERSLLDAIAKQVALIIEQRQAEADKSKLQDQLRHADRLATIGQLAAGVAHELNEPLSSILGFAQLMMKSSGLTQQTKRDIEKIVTASLHAREVIRKLMLFARQTPPRRAQVNLNRVVEEGLYFLEARCAKAGIEVVRSLSADLPRITADPAQINQVLVNLVVNSVQAMPEGGKLTVHTLARKEHVALIVEDTGVGMSEEVKKQIFIPFYTTKEVDQGTGLGLPVVHGIVTAHGGSISVESRVGCGTRFEIHLPIEGPQELEEQGRNG